jgi:hypothetical protein
VNVCLRHVFALPSKRRCFSHMGSGKKSKRGSDFETQDGEQPGKRQRGGGPSSQYGSHFGHGPSKRVNDEWQTTLEAWTELAPVLARWKRKAVWMPFFYDGLCAQHLRTLGFTSVIHEKGADFFTRAADAAFLRRVDVIIDNPPYTAQETKDAVLKALVATGKPWCMLLPSSVLFSAGFREVVDTEHVQLVLPRRVRVCKAGQSPVPFKQLVWVCHGMCLDRDINFVGV